MLLTDARRAARGRVGELIPLDEQDRSLEPKRDQRGRRARERRAVAGIDRQYQLLAAIAAVRQAARAETPTGRRSWHCTMC
jgi:predicted RNA polymerase sigma factor